MQRSSSFIWLILALLLLLPTGFGRVLIDLAGGLFLAFLTLPIIIAGLGWVGWRILQSQMKTCPACGANTLTSSSQCPICGSEMNANQKVSLEENNVPASSATIDIKAEEADP